MSANSIQLESSRLLLRQPIEADLDDWHSFDADERATAFFDGPKSRAGSWELLASNAGMWALRGCGLFTVTEKASGAFVGRVGPWIPEGAPAEIGWAILPSRWGMGFATEAATAAINWVIEGLGWTDICHCIDAENVASINVAHRLGAQWLREDFDAQGKVTQVYGQSAEQWRSRALTRPS